MMADTNPTPASAPAAAPAFVPVASTTAFWDYLKGNVPNHLKAIGIIAAIIVSVIVFNRIRDDEAQLKAETAINATLQQKFQQIGPAAIAGNSTATAPQIKQQASDAFGSAVITAMNQQNAKIQALTTTVGQIAATVNTPIPTTTPAPTATQQNATTGALTGFPMEEVRPNGAPALDSVNLFYDPTQKDSASAFKGTSWTHYNEQFTATLGSWEEQKTGGLKTTVTLKRTIIKPDPNNPGKTITVGTEDVPITGASTVYAPGAITPAAPLPRWTVTGGISKTTAGYQPAGTVDYRLTDKFGITAGAVNSALFGGVSIRLGAK